MRSLLPGCSAFRQEAGLLSPSRTSIRPRVMRDTRSRSSCLTAAIFFTRRDRSPGASAFSSDRWIPRRRPSTLLDVGSNPKYAQGHLLFMRDSVLVAQPFDPERLTLSGEPRPIAESVAVQSGTENASFGAFSVSTDGVVVYAVGDPREAFRLTWFDRAGRELAAIGDAGNFTNASLAADGRRAAVILPEPNRSTTDVWVVDLARGVRNRLTGPEGDEYNPVWTRGRRTRHLHVAASHGSPVRGVRAGRRLVRARRNSC